MPHSFVERACASVYNEFRRGRMIRCCSHCSLFVVSAVNTTEMNIFCWGFITLTVRALNSIWNALVFSQLILHSGLMTQTSNNELCPTFGKSFSSKGHIHF